MTTSEYPHPEAPTGLQTRNIPAALQVVPHWVMWRYEPRPDGGKAHKAPYTPSNIRASITNPRTWCSFDSAVQAYGGSPYWQGIGFVLTKENPTVGIDLDDCMTNGQLTPHAQEIVDGLHSYTEVSPSGKGLRILIEAEVGDFAGKRRGTIELYNYARYVTITGNRMDTQPPTIEPRLPELREFYRRYLADPKTAPTAHKHHEQQPHPLNESDDAILRRMFAGKLGDLYHSIYTGDVSQVKDQDESRADTLLMNGLAYYTHGDAHQIRRILLSSPRFSQRADKWHKLVSGKTTYLEYQIADSIRYTISRH